MERLQQILKDNESKGRRPGLVTKEQWRNFIDKYGDPNPLGIDLFHYFDDPAGAGKIVKPGVSKAEGQHRRAVDQAIAEGKPVPPEVLADYPDLAAEAGLTGEAEAGRVSSTSGAPSGIPDISSSAKLPPGTQAEPFQTSVPTPPETRTPRYISPSNFQNELAISRATGEPILKLIIGRIANKIKVSQGSDTVRTLQMVTMVRKDYGVEEMPTGARAPGPWPTNHQRRQPSPCPPPFQTARCGSPPLRHHRLQNGRHHRGSPPEPDADPPAPPTYGFSAPEPKPRGKGLRPPLVGMIGTELFNFSKRSQREDASRL